jgi:catechol 2,3-dioxygenase-like lactoylglutathione lyase family enzyme
MRVDQLNIVVDDVVATAAFYQRLGLTVAETTPEWADWLPHHQTVTSTDGVEVDIDSVAFAREWGGIDGPCVVVSLRVDSREAVDAGYTEAIAGGAAGLRSPYDAAWGARYAVVRDPSGTTLGIMSPSDPSRRSQHDLPSG